MFIILGVDFPSLIKVILLPGIFIGIGRLILKFYFIYVCNRGLSQLKYYLMVFSSGILLMSINIGVVLLIFY